MKLKKIVKDDWQKCCRWCKHYKNGLCYNNPLDLKETLSVYGVAEEGYLDQTLEETLGSISLDEFKELEYLLRSYGLSEKRIKEFTSLFEECWENFSQYHLRQELEENVAICYQNNLSSNNTFEGAIVLDPENYYCKDWC